MLKELILKLLSNVVVNRLKEFEQTIKQKLQEAINIRVLTEDQEKILIDANYDALLSITEDILKQRIKSSK